MLWSSRGENLGHLIHDRMNPLFYCSATELAQKIREGDVTSERLCSLYIGQIESVNPSIRAVVQTRFEEALVEARRCDEHLREVRAKQQLFLSLKYSQGKKMKSPKLSIDLPPFYGVPCTVKESFALKGFPHTAGQHHRAETIATKTATGIARMQRAGFIVLGTTNVSELCMWMESNNRIYGRTSNPYDLRRTAGGSSGGEGAIVSACGSPLGLGADVGGSIRMPAFFNGIFGHKATGGLVPNTGQYPLTKDAIERYCQTGPICRYAADLWPLLNVLAGPDGTSSHHREAPWLKTKLNPSQVDVSKLKIISIESSFAPLVTSVHKELKEAQQNAVNHLQAEGCQITSITLPELRDSFDIWSAMMTTQDKNGFTSLVSKEGKGIWLLWEGIKILFGMFSPFTIPALMVVFVEKFQKLLESRTEKFDATGHKLREKLDSLLDENTVILYPPYPVPAPVHNWPLARPFNFIYTGIFNVMELPVTEVPLGLSKDGLPLGVQVVGKFGCDPVTIAVALNLEKKFGGWVPPIPSS